MQRPDRVGLAHRLLLRCEPETAHRLGVGALRLAGGTAAGRWWLERRFGHASSRLRQHLFGREFPSPVGLAAGFDKDAVAVRGFAGLGFGFVEVGTVTPRPQPGNPRPRLFRHPELDSLRNRLGFNSAGMERVARRLESGYPFAIPVGANLGKNATTPLEQAEADYLELFERLAELCDYFVVNVSSPNTPGLRSLQDPGRIRELFAAAGERTRRPLLIKLSPDLDTRTAVELGRAAVDAGAAGLVLTNTTVDYTLIPGVEPSGGLSGGVLRRRSFELLQAAAAELLGECVLISVGGIDSAEEAYRRLRAGASLVQVYTALVYRGPGLVARIHRGLEARLDRDELGDVEAAVGADLRRPCRPAS